MDEPNNENVMPENETPKAVKTRPKRQKKAEKPTETIVRESPIAAMPEDNSKDDRKPVGNPSKAVEVRYEIQLGQLAGIVVIGILVSLAGGFFLGKEVGFAKGFSQVMVEKPDYCTANTVGGKVTVQCNELGNVTLENICKWASPELKDKVKLVLVT